MPGRVVLLNGVGSAGKSSIAKALQTIAATPLLHVQMDSFLDMLPEALQDHPETFRYRTVSEDGHSAVAIETGPVGGRLLQGIREAVAAMARAGNDLIVDDVLIGESDDAYRQLLVGVTFHTVGVFAPLEVLEARESVRGDRLPGLARWQFGRVHRDMQYDLEVDTSTASAMECALTIKQSLGL